MAMTEKIKILLVKKEMSAAKLAAQLETSPQNLYNKLKLDNFSERPANKSQVEISDF